MGFRDLIEPLTMIQLIRECGVRQNLWVEIGCLGSIKSSHLSRLPVLKWSIYHLNGMFCYHGYVWRETRISFIDSLLYTRYLLGFLIHHLINFNGSGYKSTTSLWEMKPVFKIPFICLFPLISVLSLYCCRCSAYKSRISPFPG